MNLINQYEHSHGEIDISEWAQGVATLHFLERLPHNHCWMNKWRIVLTTHSISISKTKSLFLEKTKTKKQLRNLVKGTYSCGFYFLQTNTSMTGSV